MRVVYIVSVWPEPQTSGASTRVLQLIDCLKEAGFQLMVASAAAKNPLSADLESLGVKTTLIKLNDSSFDGFIKAQNPELVIFDKFITEEQFGWRVAECCPGALRVLDTIDLHCLRTARALQCKNDNEQLSLQNSTSLREIAAIYRSDISLFVGDYEVEVVARDFKVPRELLYYHPLTIDAAILPKANGFNDRTDFIAIGSFLHPPNWDSVLKLKNILWPAIKNQLPHARLNIVGSYTPDKAKALHNPKEGFIVSGFVEDDFAVMQQSRIHLAPLRFGAGIKSKCMLALRAGTPTVTTAIGAEGLQPDDDWAGSICEDDTMFIEAAIRLYQDEWLFTKAQAKGAKITRHFDSKTWNPKLIEILSDTKANLVEHRERNFIGKMLLHHQHLSTRYMAKWIEAKNNAPASSD
jgi:glycosyltransferase involved in cell wall biosynthesis